MKTEEEVIEHLDFDVELPCESTSKDKRPNCPDAAPAELRVTRRTHCNPEARLINLWCEQCYLRRLTAGVACNDCGIAVFDFFSLVVSVERIK